MFFEKLLIAMKLKKKSKKPRYSHMAKSSKKIIESDASDVANVMMSSSIESKSCYSNEFEKFKGGAGGGFSGAGASGGWDLPVSVNNAYSEKCDNIESNNTHGGYADTSSSSDSSSCGGGGGD